MICEKYIYPVLYDLRWPFWDGKGSRPSQAVAVEEFKALDIFNYSIWGRGFAYIVIWNNILDIFSG